MSFTVMVRLIFTQTHIVMHKKINWDTSANCQYQILTFMYLVIIEEFLFLFVSHLCAVVSDCANIEKKTEHFLLLCILGVHCIFFTDLWHKSCRMILVGICRGRIVIYLRNYRNCRAFLWNLFIFLFYGV